MNTVVDIGQCTNQRNDGKGVTHQKLDTTGGRVLISYKNHIKLANSLLIQGNTMKVDTSGCLMECSIYQNYTASEVLVQGLAGVVNQVEGQNYNNGYTRFQFLFQGDVEEMVRAQKEMLQRFEKTNEMLTNVNSLSAVRLEKVCMSHTTGFQFHIVCFYLRPIMISRSTLRMWWK